MPSSVRPLSDVDTASDCDADIDYGYDTVSDCDADESIDELYAAVMNVVHYVTAGTPLGLEFRVLIDRYHARLHAECECRGLSSQAADLYHSQLLMMILESYYGPEYAVVFDADLSGLGSRGQEPSDAQISAMLPDERVPYMVQYRLVREGIMDELPRLIPLATAHGLQIEDVD